MEVEIFININVIENPLNLLQHVSAASNPSQVWRLPFQITWAGRDGMIYYPPRFIRDPAVFTLLIFFWNLTMIYAMTEFNRLINSVLLIIYSRFPL